MRYYNFTLKTTSAKIRAGTKINLRDYNYESNVAALNAYMIQNIKNGMTFFAYREEAKSEAVLVAFSYDEKNDAFQEAYDEITGMLSSTFSIKQFRSAPCEITMREFYDCLSEARRRALVYNWSRVIDIANLDYCQNQDINDQERFRYKLSEKIISEKSRKDNPMYDQSVINELQNIETHVNTSEFAANMVHYIISSKSVEAANDITEAIMQRLAAANRLNGRRMEIISEIDPGVFKDAWLEDIIENNYGGVIVFDLSVKFGKNPVEYGMACKYIEQIVKRYKNDCLFVFTYNIDWKGFAYGLLKELSKYLITVKLREGTGDRKAAVKYLEGMIRASKYSGYAKQAREFMKMYPGDKFTQTDVLTAFEQFEPWCLNKNELHAYDFNSLDTFMLDRDDDSDSSYENLNELIGLSGVKEQIDRIIAANVVEKERKKRMGSEYELGTMHMVFSGNPGTAKTTVAKLFAGVAKEKGILKSGIFVERGGMDLEGAYFEDKIRSAFLEAEGGVLFIDEAYSLMDDRAVTVLIQEMENRKDSVIVILAGYNDRMRGFMNINEGLKSRIPHWINFPDYNVDELTDIFKLMVRKRGFEVTEDAITKARQIFDRARYMDNFGNGRFARNLLEQAVLNQSVRLAANGKDTKKLSKKALFMITKDDINLPDEERKNEKECGAALKELDEMIGLSSVKAVLKKVIAAAKMKKLYMEKGINSEKPSLHMSFTGNPGTAKTTVARLFAEIMRDEKVLPSGTFLEVGRADLVDRYVGGTAPRVKKIFQEAQGGVLFIDEAYSLCDYFENSYGDEAINTIVQEMENHRDDVIVIFAGYSDKMNEFLDRNPGMASRIAFHVEFEDYTTDELCEITKFLLPKKGKAITDAAMDKLRSIYEKVKKDSSFGNGRFVRKMLEEAEMNLAQRVMQFDESEITAESITTIQECDIPDPEEYNKLPEKKRIGFLSA